MSLVTIRDRVCRTYGVSAHELASHSRRAEVVEPRHVAMYLAREICGHTTPLIGRFFNRDYSSVCHACRKVGDRLGADRLFAELLHELARDLPRATTTAQAVSAAHALSAEIRAALVADARADPAGFLARLSPKRKDAA